MYNYYNIFGILAIDLGQALNPESMIPILANADVQQRLTQYLPEGEVLPKSEEELRATITSPQFKQVGCWSKLQTKQVALNIQESIYSLFNAACVVRWTDCKSLLAGLF